MPPRLKQKLVSKCLEKQIQHLDFFFNDYENSFIASDNIVMKIVTQLNFTYLSPGSTVLAKGKKADFVYFIKTDSVFVTNEVSSASETDKFTNRVCDLEAGSFFGEASILFDQASEYSYVASHQQGHPTESV